MYELNRFDQRNTFSKELKKQQEKFYNSLGLTNEGEKRLTKIKEENDNKIIAKVEKEISCYFLLKWECRSFVQGLKELKI